MATKPKRLGKGLGALMKGPVVVEPTTTPTPTPRPVSRETSILKETDTSTDLEVGEQIRTPTNGVIEVEVASVTPNPAQPRRVFDQRALQELSDSIQSHGLLQPILVRDLGLKASPRWELIAGERRWRAAQLAGLKTLAAIPRAMSEQDSAEVALIENLQREDLNVVERATALRELCSRFALTHAEVSSRVGLDRSSVTNLLRLLELDAEILEYLSSGRLSMGHGRALLSEPVSEQRRGWAASAIEHQWSVRELERRIKAAVKATKTQADPANETFGKSPAITDLERRLGERLGTKVSIKTDRTGKKGSLTLSFYGLEHFENMLERMGLADHGM